MENKKMCPLKIIDTTAAWRDMSCAKKSCAWWCEWANCCAMVAIPAEISDRTHDIMQTIGG